MPQSTITRSLPELWEQTGNIYETVRIISKHANRTPVEMRGKIREKIREVANYQDALDETPTENSEQIETSKYYERLPKPTLVATTEFLSGEVHFRPPEESQDQAKQTHTTVRLLCGSTFGLYTCSSVG